MTFSVALFGTIVITVLAAPIFLADPYALDLLSRLEEPSRAHWLGTDGAGRDVLARVVNGGRLDLLIGVSGVTISFVVGGALGLVLGFFTGIKSELAMRALDVAQAFPLLVFALALLAFLGQGVLTFIYAIAFVFTPIFIRLVRSEALSVREQMYVLAAEAVGSSKIRIALRHVLPNVMTSALTQLTTAMAGSILLVGGLSFLGVGIQPPRPEWGSMVREGSEFSVTGQWWPSVFPGLAIALTVFSLHTMGEWFVKQRRVR